MEENQNMNANNEDTQAPEPKHGSAGPSIGIVIIIIIIIVGGLYFWAQKDAPESSRYETPVGEEGSLPEDAQTEALEEVSSSDEIDAIEADLEEDFADLDSDLGDLDAELDDLGL